MNYKVYQGTELKQTVTSKTAVMNGLQPNRTYEFGVESDTVQTGDGINLLKGAEKCEFPLNNNGGTQTIEKYDDETNYIQHTSSTPINGMGPWFAFTPEVGQVYTLSADVCGNGYTEGDIFHYEGAGKSTLGRVDLTDNWQRISNTFRVDSIDGWHNWAMYANNSTLLKVKRIRVEKGSVATTSVTTRGIRFNIPKTLTVGSTITLRYEEYPLGIVPIGNEPSGMFGGGNKQSLSAKVISTANGSSVVEVAGNVIDVGGGNLLKGTVTANGDVDGDGGYQVKGAFNGCDAIKTNTAWTGRYINLQSALGRTNAKAGDWYTISIYIKADKQIDTNSLNVYRAIGTDWGAPLYDIWMAANPITTQWQQYSWSFQIDDNSLNKRNTRVEYNSDTGDNWIYWAGWKLEPGTIATPYASFVDGDTFAVQPDGTCALFSEHKALYY